MVANEPSVAWELRWPRNKGGQVGWDPRVACDSSWPGIYLARDFSLTVISGCLEL